MFQFTLHNQDFHHIHFIGIGGISMSGLAELMHSEGYTISGSDAKESSITKHLMDLGIKVSYGHSEGNIQGADLVVYTDAISMNNPEFQAALRSKVDLVDRASFLGAIMRNYRTSIAVSGTHGKTTTTSMIATAMKDHPARPTIMLGGILGDLKGNIQVGEDEYFLTEACEYRANVLKYFPTTAIILNIDEDHLDFFDNIEHILQTFEGYVVNLGEEGILILNKDDANTMTMAAKAKARIVTVSQNGEADYEAREVTVSDSGLPSYELWIRGEKHGQVQLGVMGLHNVSNSLAAIASMVENGVPVDQAVSGVQRYHGVGRRLEYKGNLSGITIYDDYAHHPTEIQTSLNALRSVTKNRLITIFQPHTYTRTKLLLDSFATSFGIADLTIITDIYAAREKDYGDIHSKTLVDAIRQQGDTACYMSGFEEVKEFILKHGQPGDLVVTMGAGDVYQIGEMLLKTESEASA
ncbi:MAG: UDP-N-acetylmuramate--L-alanine ligase [Tissierellia bacterium]|nr:UDP-N-acetylmuramate--L-alanine ligase [Tissierellia bacterium]